MLNFIDIDLELPHYGDGRVYWTESAIDCYKRHCVCQDCPIARPSAGCCMKSSVLALIREFGSPEAIIEKQREKEEKILRINEVVSAGIMEHKTLKQMAKELDITLYALNKHMQRSGYRLQFEQMYKTKRGQKCSSS